MLSRHPHSNKLKLLNRYNPESGKRNEINILKSSPRFTSVRDILRRNDLNDLSKLIDRCKLMYSVSKRRHVGAHPDGHLMVAGLQKHPLTEVCFEAWIYLSRNS